MCVNRCQTRISSVTGSVSGRTDDPPRHTRSPANDGMYQRTGSLSSKAPSSHSISAATAVIGLVIE